MPSAWKGLESKYLYFLKEIAPIQTVVEIGIDYGFSLFHLAMDFPTANVIGIDPYGTLALHKDAESWVVDHIKEFPNVVFCKATSEEASQFWKLCEHNLPGGLIDILHIDAVHEYENVKSIFNDWEPLVRKGGVVMFHDICSYPNGAGKFF